MPKKSASGQLTAEHFVVLAIVGEAKSAPSLSDIERAVAAKGLRSPLGEQAEDLIQLGALEHPALRTDRDGKPLADLRRYILTDHGGNILAKSCARQCEALKARVAAAKPEEERARLDALLSFLVDHCNTTGKAEPEIVRKVEDENEPEEDLDELEAEPALAVAASKPAIRREPERKAKGGRKR